MSTIEPRSAVVTIYTSDYLDRIRHLEQRAASAKEAEGGLPRLASELPEYLELARQHDELVEEAEESAIHVRVKGLPRKVWKTLTRLHPPRLEGGAVTADDARADAYQGVNLDTFPDALVRGGTVTIDGREVSYQTILSPDLTADDLDELADIDFDRIYMTAYALNRGMVADPKADLVSRMTQKNDETYS